jgi:hypothetical protein
MIIMLQHQLLCLIVLHDSCMMTHSPASAQSLQSMDDSKMQGMLP